MKESLMEFSKTPVGSIICTGIFLLIMLLTLLSKTDFGKRFSKAAKAKAENTLKKAEDCFEEVNKVKNEVDKKAMELKNRCEEIVAIADKHTTDLENFIFTVCDNIHNEKIKNAVIEYKKKSEDKITEINEVIKEKEKEYASLYQEKSAELDMKMAEVDKLLEELRNKQNTAEKEVENE